MKSYPFLQAGDCGGAPRAAFRQISQEDAKALLDSDTPYILLDVQAQDEYEQGHIPGAMVIPHDEILSRAQAALPDKNALILVYCRSGRRSVMAARDLASLGYTQVVEFGGILTWPYEVTR